MNSALFNYRPNPGTVLAAALLGVLLLPGLAFAQATTIRPDLRGDEAAIARGVLNGNLIETNFRNHGELARWMDTPWGVWPRGIGGRHIDGIGIMVAGQVPGERAKWPEYGGRPDTTLNPVILTYRDAGKRLGPLGELWGWTPLPEFNNPNRIDLITGQRTPTPALSNDPTSWPPIWPDRLNESGDPGWSGLWNGFFGRGVFNADQEAFYVMDDMRDMEYAVDPTTGRPLSEFGVFYPAPSDSTRGGMGLQNQVRIFQWANVLAEDLMFILYRVTNIGEFNHDRLYLSQVMDYGLGNEEGDENAAFDPQQDVTFGWDQDGIGTRPSGGTYTLGYTGFAFLESPARERDGLDNDEDGATDESRFSGEGMLIEGQEQIRSFVAGNYDLTNFENFNGPLEERPAFKAGRWFTGDENLDWLGFQDDNGDGVWDSSELLNNDVGRDGVGPFDRDYPGPDEGEADGRPTRGEPNFDELDVDESDQIGLTGFDLNTRPFYESGDNLREDTWLWGRIFDVAQFPLGTKPDAFVADVEPFLLFSSGPVDQDVGFTNFFSTAWIFGIDEQDFFKNRRSAQSIFNADYTFAQPPFEPKLTAVAGDKQVILSWDTTAVRSFDRFTQEFDFEGFKLYRGTDALLSDARLITDVDGTPTFFKPIAQWDLDNGIEGPVPVLEGAGTYDMGDDSGLQFFYVDNDVRNGITYYYALVAYDRGFGDPFDLSQGPIDPQENTFNVTVNQAGKVGSVSRNAAVVVPRTTPGGFVSGGSNEDLSRLTEGIGTGSAEVQILIDEATDPTGIYQLRFYSQENGVDRYATTEYDIYKVSESRVLQSRSPLVETTPPVDGFAVAINNVEFFNVLREATGYVVDQGTEDERFSASPEALGIASNWNAFARQDTTSAFVVSPADFELRWVAAEDSLYTPPRLFGFLREPIPVFAVNLLENRLVDLLIDDRNDNGMYDVGDDLIINEQPPGSGRRFRHRVSFFPSDPDNPVPPPPGTSLRVSMDRPFRTGDFFQFTIRSSRIDEATAAAEMDRIAVVPNPYVGASDFEPRSQIEGRGERRIQFINLPAQCTIKIFTLRGELIKVLRHDGGVSDGAEFWDLRTDGSQDVAYGVYVFHVEAPGIGEHVGKFALIK